MHSYAHPARTEPVWLRRLLIGGAVGFLGLFVAVPLSAVFIQATAKGIGAFFAAIQSPDALAAIRLTLLVAAIAAPVNLIFGLAAAWLIAKFRFRGREALVTLIELPLSISPVVAGLMFVLLFGQRGKLGGWLIEHDVRVVFAIPGIILTTMFVTFPFVAREVLPALQSRSDHDEEAALTLGASGWQTFFRVTLPKIKWALLYGLLLSNARAMGEFGAVSVVSGHIRGVTNTMPLHAEILYNEYDFVGAFAVASLLTFLALVTLGAKEFIQWRSTRS